MNAFQKKSSPERKSRRLLELGSPEIDEVSSRLLLRLRPRRVERGRLVGRGRQPPPRRHLRPAVEIVERVVVAVGCVLPGGRGGVQVGLAPTEQDIYIYMCLNYTDYICT